MGRPKNPGESGLAINIPTPLKKRLRMEACRRGEPLSNIVCEILDRSLPQFEAVLDDELLTNQQSKINSTNQKLDEGSSKNGGVKIQPSLLSR